MTYSKQTMEAVELLQRLIATPSVSRDETAAADVMEGFLNEKSKEMKGAFGVNRHGNNGWCVPSVFDDSKPTVLLNAHIDTVKPVAGWQRDPFAPVFEGEVLDDAFGRGDVLYGLGSNDCGGGLVALMEVFLIHNSDFKNHNSEFTNLCEQSDLRLHDCHAEKGMNLIYLASCEEEVSGKNGIESVLPLLPKIDFAIVGEPTGMQPAIAEKGLMVIDATAHGKAGHAARNEGDNAIYHAVKDIEWLSRGQFPKQTELLGPVKNTVTIVNAGTQHNVIPDTCTFTIDVRSNECYTNEEIFAFLQEHLTSELKARSFRLSSSRIDMDHPFVKACIREGLTPFGSPTLSDQALMRFPSLKLGPGDSSRSHTADEYIKISEIDEAISLYGKLLVGS